MALALTTLAGWLDWRVSLPARGLTARVYRHGDWSSPSAAPPGDANLDPARVASAAGIDPRSAFNVAWTGDLAVEDPGVHWFKLAADDEATLSIDGRLVVDSTRSPAADRTAGGSVNLSRGVHAIEVRFVQHGGDLRLRVSWATPAYREDWRGLPLYQSGVAPASIDTIARRHRVPVMLSIAWSVWLGIALVAFFARAADSGGTIRQSLRDAPRMLRVVLAAAALLIVWSIGWGLPPSRPWGLDEIMPGEVAGALARRFSGGWHDIYPPLHYALLSVVSAPSFVVERLGWAAFDDPALSAARHLAARLFTATLGVATLAMVYLCAAEAGARRGIWAAAAAISLPFLYYAKTVNVDVPYLFWLVASFLFFLRALRTFSVSDCCGLALTTACAVCTKDQAYGFYPGMALALLVAAMRAPRSSPAPAGWRTGRVRALGLGLLVFLSAFALLQNLPFNLEGFRAHIQSITTTAGPEAYRMFPATMGGAAALVSVALALVPWCLGWPMTAAVAAGLALQLRSSRGDDSARRLLWLAAPAASYVVTFLLVVGYVYDRFLLGVLVVLALWAGVALERLAAWRPAGRPVGATAAVLVVGSTWLHAVSGNAAMAGDSRYAAEEWLRVHAAGDPIVVGVGGQEYLPNLRPWRFRLTSIRASDVFDWKAELIVVNEPHARRLGTGSSEPTALDRLERGEAGYERVFRDRTILPPYALARFATWWSSPEEEQFTNLDKIGPTISIWRRVAIDHAQQPAAR